jgi:hypothetical protein
MPSSCSRARARFSPARTILPATRRAIPEWPRPARGTC